MSSDEESISPDIFDQLTPEQREHVLHLQEVVGSLSNAASVNVLRECDWNLENAVNKVLGLHDTRHDRHAYRRSRSSGAVDTYPTVNLIPPNQHILRVSNTNRTGWWWILWLFFEPIRLTLQLISGVSRFFVSFIWPDPRNHVTDPVGDVERFVEYFRTTYVKSPRNDDDPELVQSALHFYIGSYAQALQEAKQSLRFLIVYLHGDSHEDTHDFCTKTLQHPNVVRYLNNSDEFIFWGCNIKSPEGYRVSRTLREHTYPFIGVIGLTNLSPMEYGPYASNTIGMALLGRIEGAIQPEDLVQQLDGILEDHRGATIAARLDRREREATARIRQEQDLAYQQSLAQDRAKSIAREQEQRNAELQAEERRKAMELEEARRNARALRRTCWKSRLPSPPPASDGSTVQLSLKLPNGRRLTRVFSLSDSIKILYYFVLSQEDAPEVFEIQSNYPRRILPCQPGDESDLEQYMHEQCTTTGNDRDADSGSVIRNRKTTEVVHDWTPKTSTDPPSFEQMGLCSPEVLFVIDNEA